MNKLICYLLIVCCCWQTSFAQDIPVNDSAASEVFMDNYDTDSTSVDTVDGEEEEEAQEGFQKPTIRIVTADSVRKISTQEGFGYMRYIDSFYRNNKPKAEIQKEQVAEKDSSSIFDITGIRMLYWGLALTAVIFLLYKLFFSNTSLFTQNKRIQPATVETHDTPLTIDHISQLLNNAIKEKNYRLAIRLMYLQTLSLLGEKQLLNLSPQKTNYQYVQELSGTPIQQAFSKLTMQYEYAWFGGFAISNGQFDEIYKGYSHFKSQI
jgi:hypothetical protein